MIWEEAFANLFYIGWCVMWGVIFPVLMISVFYVLIKQMLGAC